MRVRPLVAAVFLLWSAGPAARADNPDLAPIRRWLTKQEELRTLAADFTQTRSFKNLRDPLAVNGRIWYLAPGSFRWEVGDPPKTIVLRKGADYFVITPAKKRAERTPTAELGKPANARRMPMMDFPFAKNFDDFNGRFETLAVTTKGTRCHLEVLPRDPQAKNALSAIRIDFDTNTGHLIAFEFVTKDGSTLRNEFSNVRINEKLDPHRFDYDFTGYDLVDGR